MTANLSSTAWLRVLQDEYLSNYIRSGGSSVKFAVPMCDGARDSLSPELERLASSSGFVFASIDATSTKVHMIDHVFFAIAAQLPWRQTVRSVVARQVSELGLAMPQVQSGPLFQAIAEVNGLDPSFVQLELRRKIAAGVFKERRLAKDFRVAMTHLTLAELSGGDEADTDFETIGDWITGRNKALSAIKPYQIFTRPNRANARFFLESVFAWLVLAGHAGTLIVMDITRLSVARNPRDERLWYTRPAVIDAYEVLRQFIDSIDRLQGCLLVVVADREFLDEEIGGRGLGGYPALKFRVFDEVRDRRLANPLASLVRLDGSGRGDD